jgi:hypothetical protein
VRQLHRTCVVCTVTALSRARWAVRCNTNAFTIASIKTLYNNSSQFYAHYLLLLTRRQRRHDQRLMQILAFVTPGSYNSHHIAHLIHCYRLVILTNLRVCSCSQRSAALGKSAGSGSEHFAIRKSRNPLHGSTGLHTQATSRRGRPLGCHLQCSRAASRPPTTAAWNVAFAICTFSTLLTSEKHKCFRSNKVVYRAKTQAAIFTRCVQISPDNGEAWNNTGILHLQVPYDRTNQAAGNGLIVLQQPSEIS